MNVDVDISKEVEITKTITETEHITKEVEISKDVDIDIKTDVVNTHHVDIDVNKQVCTLVVVTIANPHYFKILSSTLLKKWAAAKRIV